MARGSTIEAMTVRFAFALAALAVLLRVLVPQGYMIAAPTADRPAPAIVICTGQGMLTLPADSSHGLGHETPDKGPQRDAGDHTCAFAGAAAPLIAADLPGLSAPAEYASEAAALAVARQQRPGLGLAAPPPPTTGPPTII